MPVLAAMSRASAGAPMPMESTAMSKFSFNWRPSSVV
jgi:hypothetical protein